MSTYIHAHTPTVLSSHARRTAARDAAHLLPHILPTSTILDVGCGPGTISADLAQLAPQGHITCLDLHAAALTSAQQTFLSRGITNASFTTGDVTSRLPFDDNTFDIVHAHMVVIHLPNPLAALREMRRVLKPGGLLACKDMIMQTVTWFPVDERLKVWEVGITGTIGETGADPQMGRRLKAVALEAGFEEGRVKVAGSCWAFSEQADAEFWGESCAARLEEGGGLRDKIIKGGYATVEEVDDFVAASRSWTREKGAWFGVMNGELLAWKS